MSNKISKKNSLGNDNSSSIVFRKKGAGTGLNEMFIAVFGVAFLLSLSLNIMHMMGMDAAIVEEKTMMNGSNNNNKMLKPQQLPSDGSAVHQAIKEFTSSSSRMGNKEPKIQGVSQTAVKDNTAVGTSKQNSKEEGEEASEDRDNSHLMKLATLDCKAHGGPSLEAAQEMVYWQDIPSDSNYVSPFYKSNQQRAPQQTKYLTFEPDGGGWNNIRMAMESTIGLAVAMGRTLVMPPQKKMYLLGRTEKGQQSHFSFVDFFPIEEMAKDNKAFNVVSMKDYLETQGMKGNLVNKITGKVEFPPGNRTDWDGINQEDYDTLRGYLRNVSITARWQPGSCLPAFPSSGKHEDIEVLQGLVARANSHKPITNNKTGLFHVDDPDPLSRLQDTLAGRKDLCVYNEKLQNEQVVHFQMNHKEQLRLLVHFYAFLFFEDWKEDLWMKRFVRDHLHYKDEIQCAAARVVEKIREHVKKKTGGKSSEYDSFHIRRGDFQFKETRISAEEIYENSKDELTHGSTIFIATDERDKKFFDPLRKHYDLLFLDDFMNDLKGVNSNYFGMIDQLVASRGKIFFGCWFSTFTGYINRIRGYHSVKDKQPGYKSGTLPTTYYYATISRKFEMHKYAPLRGGYFNREFPTSWRDIDKGIKALAERFEKES
ncbi:GDP-fucose protein O-fucosyltransferase [Nitzschia inconspicua]|uniref:GDP-fucose protein O-fucosyltransferase n=1 Tax=Nitzschia inconspicua TaxID=303405 RepID=A0A9K3KRI2_9STRA|nr:GDP-fucose protein O-fucosyltransferase [Nitzschia inconspicua]